jgi:hypothetical protein
MRSIIFWKRITLILKNSAHIHSAGMTSKEIPVSTKAHGTTLAS